LARPDSSSDRNYDSDHRSGWCPLDDTCFSTPTTINTLVREVMVW
jgi:hypothetical protein